MTAPGGVSLTSLCVEENSCGYAKAEQDAGNAKHGDGQQPPLISKEKASAHTSNKTDRDKRNNPWSKPFPRYNLLPYFGNEIFMSRK